MNSNLFYVSWGAFAGILGGVAGNFYVTAYFGDNRELKRSASKGLAALFFICIGLMVASFFLPQF